MAAGARVFDYTNRQPTIPLDEGEKIPFHSLRGEVTFRNVNFSYPTREKQVVLDNFSLDIPPGKMVALVGASGGGKSTIGVKIFDFPYCFAPYSFNLFKKFVSLSSGAVLRRPIRFGLH